MWVHESRIISIKNHVIPANEHYNVTYCKHGDAQSAFNRTATLHIKDVQKKHGGQYICKMNSSPGQEQIYHLNVLRK